MQSVVRSGLVGLLVLFVGCGGEVAQPYENPEELSTFEELALTDGRRVAKNRLIVTLRDKASAEFAELTGAGIRRVRNRLGAIGAVVLEVDDAPDALARLVDDPNVAEVELDEVVSLQSAPPEPSDPTKPNDTYFATYQWNLLKSWARSAWAYERGEGALVAVVDSGIYAGHQDLDYQVVKQRDFVYDDNEANDPNGHGTHVAGIIAAETNNSVGIAGAAPKAKLMAARVFNAEGKTTTSDILAAIRWSVENGADVINLSMGGSSYSSAWAETMRWVASRGVFAACAAGNESKELSAYYPASYEGCLAVAATTSTDARASYSNTGPFVDIAAPGSDILSTCNSHSSSYCYMSGTSMATPHVAAAAALLAAQGRTRAQIVDILLRTARDVSIPGPDTWFGAGVVNMRYAVLATP